MNKQRKKSKKSTTNPDFEEQTPRFRKTTPLNQRTNAQNNQEQTQILIKKKNQIINNKPKNQKTYEQEYQELRIHKIENKHSDLKILRFRRTNSNLEIII